jgi:HlyD family secretion protein
VTTEVGTEEVARTLGVKPGRAAGRSRRAISWILIGIVGLALAATVRVAVQRAKAGSPQRYVTAQVERGDLRVTVTATGTLSALGAVDVGSEVSGRVQNVYVDYNQRVTKGQLLAELDPVELNAAAAQASAQLAANRAAIKTAQATLVEATQALDRAQTQVSQGLVAAKELESARAVYARADAAVASAKANAAVASASVNSAAWKLTKTKIVSPIAGVVLSRSVAPGQTVAAAFQTPVLFKLATDLAALELNVQVDESDVGRVREGLPADFRVDAYPERVFNSRVQAVRNEAKTSSNVVYYEAILTVDNSERLLRPGMTATASITSELHGNVLRVPNAALRFEPPAPTGPPGALGGTTVAKPGPLPQGKKRVYTLTATGAPLAVEVTPGATDGTHTEIRAVNLDAGAKVIVDVEDGASP